MDQQKERRRRRRKASSPLHHFISRNPNVERRGRGERGEEEGEGEEEERKRRGRERGEEVEEEEGEEMRRRGRREEEETRRDERRRRGDETRYERCLQVLRCDKHKMSPRQGQGAPASPTMPALTKREEQVIRAASRSHATGDERKRNEITTITPHYQRRETSHASPCCRCYGGCHFPAD
ncbi:hypothetical protein EYF80_030070 [Liparis tanakae]|uniref:Uncharacterized protein n=1 Tax=Liparis tanakae TaxID=230148 RepID=A0A4Z2H1Q5_9TELE|nr:hypothetical protein EYF80_030070 [Liparis tanakae]